MATSQDISTLQDLWNRGSTCDEDDNDDDNDIAIGTSGEIVISRHISEISFTRRAVYKLNETGSYVKSKTLALYQEGKEIVSILENMIIVSNDSYLRLYSINFSGPLKVMKLEKNPTCIFAHRNALFVTSADSSKVMVYSPELVKESEICLKDIDDQQYPVDLAVTESFIYICTASSGKAISFEKTTGNKQFAFENTQEHISFAISITVNATADLVLVLFKTNRILLFPLNSSRCLIAIDFAAVKIRALQKGQLVAVDKSGVHIFEMKTTVLHKLMRKLNEMKLQQTELEKRLSEEQDKRNEYKGNLDKKTKELEKLKEMQLQQTEIERKLSGEQEKRKEYKGNLDKKTTQLQELTDKLHVLKSQKTELEKKLSGYQTSTSHREAIEKATKLEETIDRMKSAEKERAKQLSKERKRDMDHQEAIKKMLQTVQSHIDGLNESIENFTYRKRTFIGDSQPDTGLSTTDPEEDSSIATATATAISTGGETIRKGNYNTIASKDSGISFGSNASGQDEAVKDEPSKLHSETIRLFLKGEDMFSTLMYEGNYFNLVVAANIGTEGGELEIPGTNGSISIPPKALRQLEDITIRIVPPETWMEESESFASNSFSVIELLPNNLKLDKPAKVKIPHCLQIARRAKPKVEIYISHHEDNCPPHWEKSTEHKYKLEDDVCTVYTSSFCWIKVEIDDQIVEAKKIQVFATVPKITPGDSTSLFTIGYFPDLPGFTHEKEAIEKKCFLFKKENHQSLSIALTKTVPKFWNNQPPSSPQEIPFSDIELSKDRSCKFPLLKRRSCRGIPLCRFTVSQGTSNITLSVRPPISSP